MTICPACRFPSPNDGVTPCTQCYPDPKVIRSVPPKIISKLNHLNATTAINTYDFPPNAHSKAARIHHHHQHQQRNRKGITNHETSPIKSTSLSVNQNGKADVDQVTASSKAANNLTSNSSLSFIITPFNTICDIAKIEQRLNQSRYAIGDNDLKVFLQSQQYLRMTGWYHEHLNYTSANDLIIHTSVGSFLIRNSSDAQFFYTLTVQTKCGPSSIRIWFGNGRFRLDGNDDEIHLMPTFPCIMQLLQHYAEETVAPLICGSDENYKETYRLLDYSPCLLVELKKPIYTDRRVPSLKHLTRLCINRNLKDPNLLSVLPTSSYIINYLLEYPFRI